MPRILLKERSAFGNTDTGGAWLSSARVVRCSEKDVVYESLTYSSELYISAGKTYVSLCLFT
ncbi:hypothetical protein MTR_3g028290 [Medicago truncatula]|uniref:Uncharacterized protein n=1 Tax=Medicago truncatula TaxID=3880 RepID=G7IZE2_MEDTR|nr:hypothetical protein MTR_3g028290 [Medicago truncatula]